jgi:hypothetical protein
MINISDDINNTNKLNKIKKIAKQIRKELETTNKWKNNKSCFYGRCHDISKYLSDELNKNSIYAYRVMGQYSGANELYKPDMSDWTEQEKKDYEFYMTEINGINPTYTHWWVVAENEYIIDITCDQFHPGDEENYRIVITSIGDTNYSA